MAVRRVLAACALPLVLLACAGHRGPLPAPAALLQEDPFDAHYKIHCDSSTGNTVCVMTGNALRPLSPRYPLLSLGLISEIDKAVQTKYFLRVLYVNEAQWLNIGPGNALTITVDGTALAFAGGGSAGTRYTGEAGKVYETARYETDAATIKMIARAKSVTVRVSGVSPLEKSFGSVNFLYFQQFIHHYVDKAPASGT